MKCDVIFTQENFFKKITRNSINDYLSKTVGSLLENDNNFY